MIVYAAMSNPMIHESVFGIVSLHETIKGAEMAIEFHKKEVIEEEGEEYVNNFMAWIIREYELLK